MVNLPCRVIPTPCPLLLSCIKVAAESMPVAASTNTERRVELHRCVKRSYTSCRMAGSSNCSASNRLRVSQVRHSPRLHCCQTPAWLVQDSSAEQASRGVGVIVVYYAAVALLLPSNVTVLRICLLQRCFSHVVSLYCDASPLQLHHSLHSQNHSHKQRAGKSRTQISSAFECAYSLCVFNKSSGRLSCLHRAWSTQSREVKHTAVACILSAHTSSVLTCRRSRLTSPAPTVSTRGTIALAAALATLFLEPGGRPLPRLASSRGPLSCTASGDLAENRVGLAARLPGVCGASRGLQGW